MSRSVKCKSDLDTPSLLLDLDILEENLRRMQARVERAGKKLRPHAKTHKCSALAKRQIEVGASGVCVAKVSEAERLVAAGVNGILVTGPVVTPHKITRLVNLRAVSPSLMAVVDHRQAVEGLHAALAARDLSMDVLIDIDIGLHRTGVKPEDALPFAEWILSHKNLRLRGIQAYAGQVQHILSYPERMAASRLCLQSAGQVFHELQAQVQTCDIFSASGTGTHDIDLAVPEVTELQAGSYACMDAQYRGIGSAEDEAQFLSFGPALRLLTTVVSVNQAGFVTVDAGLKALYQDGGAPLVLTSSQNGFTYDWFGDEYGRITCSGGADALPLGSVLELFPAHCDPTINLFDRFHLARGDEVVGTWQIDLRGCSE